jgi:hypothetical protein
MLPSLKPFLEQVLTAADLKHVWLEEDLVRIWSHPQFSELFGDAAALDLALSEEALRDHPAATLCTPGSFALDRLIQWARSGQGAFSSRLSAQLPDGELPAGLPHLANGVLAVHERVPGERAILYALFRVSLHSDELVEHLLPLAFEQDGTPRPDLTARLEECRRAPSGGSSTAIPDPLLSLMESHADRAARELAREHLPAVQARKAREIERLERYVRALRDELAGELPAGAARRSAQIKAESRALLDTLVSVLPGEGPWQRDTLLPSLKHPSVVDRFRRPAQAPIIPPEMHDRVVGLIRRLPAQFSMADAERLLLHDTERRLERLARQGKDGGSAATLLDEQERRLEEEHRSRIADIEQKFHLRVLAQPMLLEWLEYPVLDCRVLLSGRGSAELALSWNPLAEAWAVPCCRSCGAEIGQLWLCEHDHLACEACASVCRRCSRARCPSCAFTRCARCQSAACEDCGRTCDCCGGWNCDRHGTHCPQCGMNWCSRCGHACYSCDSALCPEHGRSCALCGRAACAEHAVECHTCSRAACLEHGDRCPHCTLAYCSEHSAPCRFCGQTYCAPCAGNLRRGAGDRCATCRELEEMGPTTIEALRSRVREAAPGVDPMRFRQWWLARNGRYWIIAARRWPWNHIFVLQADSRELVSHRRYWSWRGP